MLIVLNLSSNVSLPSIKYRNTTFPKLTFFQKFYPADFNLLGFCDLWGASHLFS